MKLYFQNMNSGITDMNSFLVAVIYLTVLAPDQTRAAVCPQQTPNRCQATDYTLPTCNNATQMCDCKSGYLPIPTGCAARLEKPVVNLDDGRTAQFVPAATVRLNCFTNEIGSLVFEWLKDGVTVPGQNTSVLTLTGNDKDKTGNFSCITRDTTVNFTSEASDEKEIIILTTTLAAAVVPVVTVSPPAAAPGVKLDVRCTNIPYGATFKFKLTPGDKIVDNVTQDSTLSVTCVLDVVNNLPWSKQQSDAVKLPTNATEIRTVTITPSTTLTYKIGTSVKYTCGTDPEAKFLESGTNIITYTFKDSLVTSPTISGNSYTIISTSGNATTRTVSCGATWAKNTEKTSALVSVIFSDSYIKTPTVNASSTEVHTGASLVLTCDTEVNNAYTWLKDGKKIARQADRIIQVGNFQPADAGKYVCTAQKGAYIASSPELLVKSGAAELRVLASTVTVLIAGITGRLL